MARAVALAAGLAVTGCRTAPAADPPCPGGDETVVDPTLLEVRLVQEVETEGTFTYELVPTGAPTTPILIGERLDDEGLWLRLLVQSSRPVSEIECVDARVTARVDGGGETNVRSTSLGALDAFEPTIPVPPGLASPLVVRVLVPLVGLPGPAVVDLPDVQLELDVRADGARATLATWLDLCRGCPII